MTCSYQHDEPSFIILFLRLQTSFCWHHSGMKRKRENQSIDRSTTSIRLISHWKTGNYMVRSRGKYEIYYISKKKNKKAKRMSISGPSLVTIYGSPTACRIACVFHVHGALPNRRIASDLSHHTFNSVVHNSHILLGQHTINQYYHTFLSSYLHWANFAFCTLACKHRCTSFNLQQFLQVHLSRLHL